MKFHFLNTSKALGFVVYIAFTVTSCITSNIALAKTPQSAQGSKIQYNYNYDDVDVFAENHDSETEEKKYQQALLSGKSNIVYSKQIRDSLGDGNYKVIKAKKGPTSNNPSGKNFSSFKEAKQINEDLKTKQATLIQPRNKFDIYMGGIAGFGGSAIVSILRGGAYGQPLGLGFGDYAIQTYPQVGGEIRLNIGPSDKFFFLNLAGRVTFDKLNQNYNNLMQKITDEIKEGGGTPSTNFKRLGNTGFDINGQVGIGWNTANTHSKNFIAAKLFGIDASYADYQNFINPSNLISEKSYMGINGITSITTQDLNKLLTINLNNANAFAGVSSYWSVGPMFGWKFTQYHGRFTFSQTLIGAMALTQYTGNIGFDNIPTWGATLKASLRFDIGYALNQAQTVYLMANVQGNLGGYIAFTTINPIHGDLVNNLIKKINELIDTAGSIIDPTTKLIDLLGNSIETFIDTTQCMILGKTVNGSPCNGMPGNSNGMNGYFNQITTIINKIITTVGSTSGTLQGTINNITGNGGAINNITTIISGMIKEVNDLLTNPRTTIDNLIRTVSNMITYISGSNGAIENLNGLVGTFGGLIKDISGNANSILGDVDELTNLGANIIRDLTGLITDGPLQEIITMVQDALKIFQSFGVQIGYQANQFMDFLQDILSGKVETLNKHFNVAAAVTFGVYAGVGIYIKI